MPFVAMMDKYSPGQQLKSAALMHHDDPSGFVDPLRISMMHQHSAGELLTSTVLVHHDNKINIALRQYPVLKELTKVILRERSFLNNRGEVGGFSRERVEKNLVPPRQVEMERGRRL